MIYRIQDNTLTAYGYIWEGDGMEFIHHLESLEKTGGQIKVRLHTYGGSVFDGNLIYNALRDSKADIRIEIIGIAASMGAIIALSRKEVYMAENGFLMIHAASGSTRGTAEDHLQTVKLLRSIEDNFIKKLMQKTGQDKKHVEKWLQGDNWINAQEALSSGLIAGVIEPEAEIGDLEPQNLGSQEVYNRFAAALIPRPPDTTTNSNSKSKITMKRELINALGLKSVTGESSDTAIIDAVKAHYEEESNQLKADLNAAKTKLKELEDQGKAQADKAIKAILSEAKKSGKITATQEDTYQRIAEASGVEALKTVLASIPARQNLKGAVHGSTNAGTASALRADWGFDKWQKEDPQGLEQMEAENPEEFKALLNQKYSK